MNRKENTIRAVVIAAAMLISLLWSNLCEKRVWAVESAVSVELRADQTEVCQGDRFNVTISVAENPGVSGLVIRFCYDKERLKLCGVAHAAGSSFRSAVIFPEETLAESSETLDEMADGLVGFAYVEMKNNRNTGDLLVAAFEVRQRAKQGETKFTYDYLDASDMAGNVLDIKGEELSVAVVEKSSDVTAVNDGGKNADVQDKNDGDNRISGNSDNRNSSGNSDNRNSSGNDNGSSSGSDNSSSFGSNNSSSTGSDNSGSTGSGNSGSTGGNNSSTGGNNSSTGGNNSSTGSNGVKSNSDNRTGDQDGNAGNNADKDNGSNGSTATNDTGSNDTGENGIGANGTDENSAGHQEDAGYNSGNSTGSDSSIKNGGRRKGGTTTTGLLIGVLAVASLSAAIGMIVTIVVRKRKV